MGEPVIPNHLKYVSSMSILREAIASIQEPGVKRCLVDAYNGVATFVNQQSRIVNGKVMAQTDGHARALDELRSCQKEKSILEKRLERATAGSEPCGGMCWREVGDTPLWRYCPSCGGTLAAPATPPKPSVEQLMALRIAGHTWKAIGALFGHTRGQSEKSRLWHEYVSWKRHSMQALEVAYINGGGTLRNPGWIAEYTAAYLAAKDVWIKAIGADGLRFRDRLDDWARLALEGKLPGPFPRWPPKETASGVALLSNRTLNCLLSAGKSVQWAQTASDAELLALRNFGKAGLAEIRKLVSPQHPST